MRRLLIIFAAVCGLMVATLAWLGAELFVGRSEPDAAQAGREAPPRATQPSLDVAAPLPESTPRRAAPPAVNNLSAPAPESPPDTSQVLAQSQPSVRWAEPRDERRSLAQLATAREILTHDPRHPRALEDELAALRALGRRSEAADTLARIVEIEPDNREHRLEYAEALLRLGQWMRAMATLQVAVEKFPDDAQAWAYLAAAQQAMGHLQEADHSWGRVLELRPDDPDAYAGRGAVLLELRDWPNAAADLERAGQLRPGDAGVAINRSVALAHLGRVAEAQQCVLHILDQNPHHVRAMNRLAEIAWLVYRADPGRAPDELIAAIDWWRRSLAIDPQQPAIQALLDTALTEQKARP